MDLYISLLAFFFRKYGMKRIEGFSKNKRSHIQRFRKEFSKTLEKLSL